MSIAASGAEQALSALDNRPMSSLQRKAAILVSMGEFISGYDLLVMGAALIYLRPQFDLSPSATGLLGASTFLGAMVGLLIFGDLSDRLGRRAIFVANLIFFVFFSIVSAFITDATQLFIARFLVGMGVGMDIPTSTAYLAEIAPRKQRGAILGSLPQIMWILGAMLSTFIALPLGYFFGDQAWRWMFGLAAVPALLVLIGRRLLPESPRWLLAQGRLDEARDALKRFDVPVEESLTANREKGSYGELFYPSAVVTDLLGLDGVLPQLPVRADRHHRDTLCAALHRADVGDPDPGVQRPRLGHKPDRCFLQLLPDRPHRPQKALLSVADPGRHLRAVDGPVRDR